ncbi:RING-H2 finger protein ATL8-like [Apium graveolens]|uniref:RING-H2 finger protein ATL8-like n=1 Tax=Apium graveolens TaxID=4045 RepID=UPI003D7AF790
MTLLQHNSRKLLTTTDSPDSTSDDAAASDFIVILAALLCAIVCLLGLIAVARCAWIRRFSGRITGTSTSPPHLHPNKGLNNKILKKIPKFTYSGEHAGKYLDCAICLTEFVAGDVLRSLPNCGHGFHVGCIDTWLKSHSSCPSCRQLLVDSSCRKCSELTAPEIRVAGIETLGPRQDDTYRFLP